MQVHPLPLTTTAVPTIELRPPAEVAALAADCVDLLDRIRAVRAITRGLADALAEVAAAQGGGWTSSELDGVAYVADLLLMRLLYLATENVRRDYYAHLSRENLDA